MHIPPTINNRIESINHWTNKTDRQSTSKPVGLIVVWFRARHLNSQSNNNWQTVSSKIIYIKIPTFSISLCKNRRSYHHEFPIVHKTFTFRSSFHSAKIQASASFLYSIKKYKKNKKETEEESYRTVFLVFDYENRDTLFRKAKKWSQDSGVVTWRDNLTSWIRALDPIIRQKGGERWKKKRKGKFDQKLVSSCLFHTMKGDDNLSSTNDVCRWSVCRVVDLIY